MGREPKRKAHRCSLARPGGVGPPACRLNVLRGVHVALERRAIACARHGVVTLLGTLVAVANTRAEFGPGSLLRVVAG
eukprot:5212802-Pyramimonas_sp.AAC.1